MTAKGRRWIQFGSIVVLLILWTLLSLLLGDDDVLPAPHDVLTSMIKHWREGELQESLLATFARVAASFVIAMAIGCAVGLWMGRSDVVDAVLDPMLIAGLNLPALVTIIICYVWFGLNDAAAVTAVALNKIPTVIVTLREGGRSLDRRLLEVAEAYRLPVGTTLRKVVLPQLYPFFMAAARSGLALIWKIVLVVELLGRSNGVGFQLGTFFTSFDMTSILAYALSFAAIIMTIEFVIIQPLDRKARKWRY